MSDLENVTESEKKESLPAVYWWLFGFIFLAGFLLRWAGLDDRPVHHDESLHLMYGRYFFDWPEQHYYKYDAMLHGPLLYNVLRFVYLTLGSTTWAGRSLVCVLGTIMMFSPLLFRKYFTRNALLALCSAIALSPTLIYWSRFIREDNLQLFAMLMTLVGVVLVKDRLKVLVAFLGITLQFCEKENSFVTTALLAGFMLFEFAFYTVIHKSREGLLVSLFGYLRKFWKEALVALGSGAIIYAYLYSAGFRHPDGILDGLYRKSIIYWMNQHNIERISGPFFFHLYVLSWYELAFIVAALVQLVIFYSRAIKPVKLGGLFVLVLAVLFSVTAISQPEIRNYFPFKFYRLKEPVWLEIFGAIVITLHPLLLTIDHLWRKQRVLAFWGYLFTASLFTYSYLGEKVPWLTIYPFVAGLVYLVLYFQDYFATEGGEWLKTVSWRSVLRFVGSLICISAFIFIIESGEQNNIYSFVLGVFQEGVFKHSEFSNAIVLGVGVLLLVLAFIEGRLKIFGTVDLRILVFIVFVVFTLRVAGLTNFVYAGKASEFLSQVHTTQEFHNFILKVKDEIKTPLSGVSPEILATEDAVWPVTWYMVDTPQFKFTAPDNERSNFSYIIKNWKEGDDSGRGKGIPDGYRAVRMNLRGWWVPDYGKMTLKKFLYYSFNHIPWSDTGYSYVTVLVKEK